jgi:hypothetical protein
MMISGVAQVEIIHNRMELQMIIINNKMEKALASTHPSIHPSSHPSTTIQITNWVHVNKIKQNKMK